MSRCAWVTGLFVSLISSVLSSQALAQKQALTARQMVGRIRDHLGVPVPSPRVDTFRAGSPDTEITGLAVTMMATFDVFQKAVAQAVTSSPPTSPPSTITSIRQQLSRTREVRSWRNGRQSGYVADA